MKTTIKLCEVCPEEFIVTRRHAKYCSAACRQLAYRKRNIEQDFKNATEKQRQKYYQAELDRLKKEISSIQNNRR